MVESKVQQVRAESFAKILFEDGERASTFAVRVNDLQSPHPDLRWKAVAFLKNYGINEKNTAMLNAILDELTVWTNKVRG